MRIILIGRGKMGTLIRETAAAAGDEIEAVFGRDDLGQLGRLGRVADVVMDFSRPEALPEVASYVRRTGTPLLSGTTGYTEAEKGSLFALGSAAPVLWSANYSLGVAVLALLAGYGKSRRLLRVSLVFFAVSAAFGGGVFALQLLGGRGLTLQNGIFYSAMDLRLILLSAAGCYVLITLLFQRTARHSGLRRELVPAVLTLEGRRVALTALVDTGNTLTDPATGRPVMVAEGEKVGALFPDGQAPAPEELRRPVEALERLGRQGWQGRCRLLPYQAVGVECGMLLALRLDGARVGTEDYGKLLLALSPTRLTDGGGYHALIGT